MANSPDMSDPRLEILRQHYEKASGVTIDEAFLNEKGNLVWKGKYNANGLDYECVTNQTPQHLFDEYATN